jgi:hypothetical protein
MPIGHMFLVAHPRAGEPLLVTYAVADRDRREAAELLERELNEPGVDIRYGRQLSSIEIRKLELAPGKFRSVWPSVEL